jgi:hypothetical protein
MKTRSVGPELFRPERHEDGRTDMTQLIVASRNFANAPKIQFTSDSKTDCVFLTKTTLLRGLLDESHET